MFCSGSRFENVRAGPASYVVFGARKLTSKRSRSGNAVRSEPCWKLTWKQKNKAESGNPNGNLTGR